MNRTSTTLLSILACALTGLPSVCYGEEDESKPPGFNYQVVPPDKIDTKVAPGEDVRSLDALAEQYKEVQGAFVQRIEKLKAELADENATPERKKELEKAVGKLSKALSMEPASPEVIFELRSLYKQQAEEYKSRDEDDKAVRKYEEILRIDPNSLRNIEIYMELGDIYYYNELYDKAAAMYEAATKLDPLNFDAFKALKELELRGTDSEEE